MNKRGVSLVFIIFMVAVLLIMGSALMRVLTSGFSQVFLADHSLRAFYLAEGALEHGKQKFNKNPAWFTDLPHPVSDDAEWLINTAKGEEYELYGEIYKIVREKGKPIIYGIGRLKGARKVVKYDILNGYWEEI
jgi:hypothetical protein